MNIKIEQEIAASFSDFDVFEETEKWAKDQTLFFLAAQKEVPSTNLWAKSNLLPPVMHAGLYLTRHQTAGRGRGSHEWKDTGDGHALLASWIFRLEKPPQPIASPLFGLSLFQAAQCTWSSISFGLKPPNDLYLKEKKIAGLLLECVTHFPEYYLIVGLGFNVFSSPKEVKTATHLQAPAIEQGFNGSSDLKIKKMCWRKFLDRIYKNFLWASQLCDQPYLKAPERQQLLIALNAYADSPQWTHIGANGDLSTHDRYIQWMDL